MTSPIERIMASALWGAAAGSNRVTLVDEVGRTFGEGTEWTVHSNHRIQSYRADFLLVCEDWDLSVAVECDGHEFHDRTKQQAAYDRARDRDLLKAGIVTLRFTGSEIVHSPERCVEDVLLVLDELVSVAQARWSAGHTAADKGRRTLEAERDEALTEVTRLRGEVSHYEAALERRDRQARECVRDGDTSNVRDGLRSVFARLAETFGGGTTEEAS